ncbi:MAG: hypothetical protein PF961_04410 [Planctomycetota bacterium]|nr:hypothetical protein [Planctomycetota bacterium]
MKLVVLGAGSYVFAPTVIIDAYARLGRGDIDLALVDLNHQAATTIAGVATRIAANAGLNPRISAHTQIAEALPGADMVICCAAIQGQQRFARDAALLQAHGLGGLAYSLRSIHLVLDLCAQMWQLCPQAWLLDVTNPMPRVVTAAWRYGGVRSIGFSNAAWGSSTGHQRPATALGRSPDELITTSAGLNHFAWLLDLRERATGRDLLGELEHLVASGTTTAFGKGEIASQWLQRYGAIAMSGTSHQSEWISDAAASAHSPFHGDPAEREAAWADLAAIAAGTRSWQDAAITHSWEHPVAVACALHDGTDLSIDMANVPNDGHLPQLPAGAIIEAPISCAGGSLSPGTGLRLPGQVAAICQQVSAVHELLAEGAARASITHLHQAINRDPAIPETQRDAAHTVLPLLVREHADILGWEPSLSA